MNFFRDFFNWNKKKDKQLFNSGRYGLIYKRYDEKYFISSEWFDHKPNMRLYLEHIFFDKNRSIILSIDQKRAIAHEVKEMLESEGITVEIYDSA